MISTRDCLSLIAFTLYGITAYLMMWLWPLILSAVIALLVSWALD